MSTKSPQVRWLMTGGNLNSRCDAVLLNSINTSRPIRLGSSIRGGAVGYLDYRGNMDTCIALRTMVISDGIIHVQAGCGVVIDSDPNSEYEETVNKAQALIQAIRVTSRRSH